MGRVLLLIVLVTAVAFGAAAFIHPDGVDGALGMLGVRGSGGPAIGGAGSGAAPSALDAAHAAARTLGKGDAEYDAGRFDKALLLYTAVATTAPTESLRDRARRSGRRATLAHALLDGLPAPAETDAGARRSRLDELTTRARATNDEADWLAALRYAGSVGASGELAALVRGTLAAAVAGGPVNDALNRAGARAGGAARRAVDDALAAHGLVPAGDVLPGRAGSASGLSHPDAPDEGASGIGGVTTGAARLPRVDVPPAMLIRGTFSAATRKSLERGVDAEREGLQHFQLSGAEGTDRKEHRRQAYRLLREAQRIFDEASDEDDSSTSLEGHIVRVNRAIALLRKEMTPDEVR